MAVAEWRTALAEESTAASIKQSADGTVDVLDRSRATVDRSVIRQQQQLTKSEQRSMDAMPGDRAAVKLSQLFNVLKWVCNERDLYETSSCRALMEQIKWFAGTQIRNVASVGGNICTASPISDLNPLWMAARAKLQIMDVEDYGGYLAKDQHACMVEAAQAYGGTNPMRRQACGGEAFGL
ncbi:unnamed protein product [Cuscuta campestris]|uniref:Molybdopterin dehydrogenase FAD-binding domain-containing protein n=1 Tax=Cuscuta campestris TaxID=132261 RepID=A0A484LAI9_9ASTE|nr:unnamed protein product [Cuscuta campestris]